MKLRNHASPSIAIDGREITNKGTGIGRYTKNLIINLLELDKSTKYYVLTNGEKINFEKYKNLTVLSSKAMKRGKWEKNFVPQMMRKYKVDLFHNTRSGNTFFQKIDHPYITTVHDLIPLIFQEDFPQKVVDRWKNSLSPYLHGAKHIITISQQTTKDLTRLTGIDKEKISVIHQGIDPLNKRKSNVHAKLVVKENYDIKHPYFLVIGRKQHYKNISALLKAYSLLPDPIKKQYKLVITGKDVENYRNLIKELSLLEYVRTLGYVPDKLLPDLYCGSKLFVFPSLYEGFGLPPLEAMAYGVPVLSSNMNTMKEILGDAAIYFDPKNPHDIAEKMILMLKNDPLCKAMSEKGLKQAEKYSWKKTARQTLQVYDSVLQIKRR
ncbi:glycosyltransferase family 4 protein [Metabacillus arenae]|uniref:Glycosyltransferase family 4 protein n=1 Tax=Metabacillus arenae TaxID=2771434 RepID=A0A926NPY1_9BACI|nr:glycosyltransferase family 1 protein [Metabacillus arenae]MBD1381912.1 glycosyltransferase family 4 protein [Metabacillus arenae]